MHLRVTAAAFLVAIAMAWAVMRGGEAQKSVSLSQVSIASVQRGSFVRDVAADGQVVAAISPTLYAPSSGTVTLNVHAGDAVDKGQVLAVLESAELTAKLHQEESVMEELKIELERTRLDATQKLEQLNGTFRQADIDRKTVETELDRTRKAYELGSYPKLQVVRAESNYEKAQFAYDQARASYESQPQRNRFDVDSKKTLLQRQRYLVEDLRRQVDALQIRSPVTGRVGQVQVADRQNVSKDAALLSVVDLSALEVEIKVPESLARDLTIGMQANIDGDGRRWTGEIRAISPQVVNGEVAARVHFRESKLEGLRQNQRVSVRIFIDRRENVLSVDRGPFYEQDGGGFVYVVHGRVAERHAVRLGAASIQKVEILGGLNVGDKIVISGSDTFYGAQRVNLAN